MNLTMGLRKKMPSSSFGLPKTHGFPMNDPTHDRLAIGGATRAESAGNISPGQEAAIKAKARAKLGISGGGTVKDAMVSRLRGDFTR